MVGMPVRDRTRVIRRRAAALEERVQAARVSSSPSPDSMAASRLLGEEEGVDWWNGAIAPRRRPENAGRTSIHLPGLRAFGDRVWQVGSAVSGIANQ